MSFQDAASMVIHIKHIKLKKNAVQPEKEYPDYGLTDIWCKSGIGAGMWLGQISHLA